MSKVIAIDAGHGYNTSGKRCLKSIDPNQTREWYLNDRIADRLQELLAGYDCKVLRVDDTTGVKDISLSARVKAANNANADIYVSIHHNAGINGGSGGGTAVYYCSNKLARAKQAKDFYNMIVDKTCLKGNRSEPVKFNGFYVIQKTTMPAFLIENGFMDSTHDTPIILTKEHAEKTAQGILNFLVKELSLTKGKQVIQAPEKATGVYYPKYTGKHTTIAAAMTEMGIDGSFKHRKLIAAANNMTGYIGTAAQNTQMLNLLKAGLLIKE